MPRLQSLLKSLNDADRSGGPALLADVLLDLCLVGLLLFAAVDAFAPRQDLAWKPLSLDDPLGLATGYKVSKVTATPEACLDFLQAEGVPFNALYRQSTDAACAVEAPVRLGGTSLMPASPVMACQAAVAFELWRRQSVEPAARAVIGSGVAAIDHFGTFACRKVRGSQRLSQHATARAIDIAGFRFEDGRRVTVARDWKAETSGGRFLSAIHGDACGLFHAVLSPDYNAAHADHLHLDTGRFRICR